MSPSDILIRAAELEDMAQVTGLMNQPKAIWGTLQLPFVSVETRRKRHAASGPAHTRLVAEIEGQVIGIAMLHPADNLRRGHAASIGMAVHDAYSGRGAGRALLAALIDQADRWLDIRRLELTVFADNARAVALYERFGFEREGVMRAYAFRDGAYADAVAMARLRL